MSKPPVAILSYDNLVHALAGSAGSVTAMSAFYPLDTIRARLQLDDRVEAKNTLVMLIELTKREGIPSLYRGLVPVLQSLCVSNFVYFYSFHGLKSYISDKIPASAIRDLFLGSVAGVINVLTTTPLWVVNTRMKMQGLPPAPGQQCVKYKNLLDGLNQIYKREGLQALWAGTLPSLMLVINPAIQFMTYESVKRRLRFRYGDREFSSLVYFLVGAVAKTVATVLTYPLQIVQTKLRHGHKMEGLRPNASMQEIFRAIIRKYGLKGIFKGMESKILQTVLTSALMFTIYEKIAAFVFRLMRVKRHIKS
ncbi:peroxisomal membrane protein PMP34 [Folsomia candida]|uniref:Peroxisomal membrane protein PMP34 n=1 Tax=Folsomia candida TaxID=158441 RepID=A0A226EGU3_FOLCA|nr:peroxisomal membrane protein PMP34 [Folsomia candida]XP_035705671.1 peroxisomal membrane protein PMP34 [Folsomia candida]OXA56812.1 Peroxisomal membrane protein PMP34 [Folsomia candida]